MLNANRDWLADRIDGRFDLMMEADALEEVAGFAADGWDPTLPSAQAIGAAELWGFLQGETPLEEAISVAKAKTRQYAKRQRTWFRRRMKDWLTVDPVQPERCFQEIVTSFT